MQIIDYQTTIAWRCPHCGRLTMDTVDIFDFSGQNQRAIACECGCSEVKLGKKKDNKYWLKYFCILCETAHVKVYHKSDFWAPTVKRIECAARNIELGYIGNYQAVNNLVKEEKEYLAKTREKLNIRDYLQTGKIGQTPPNQSEKSSLRKLEKIKILEGVVRALQKPLKK